MWDKGGELYLEVIFMMLIWCLQVKGFQNIAVMNPASGVMFPFTFDP